MLKTLTKASTAVRAVWSSVAAVRLDCLRPLLLRRPCVPLVEEVRGRSVAVGSAAKRSITGPSQGLLAAAGVLIGKRACILIRATTRGVHYSRSVVILSSRSSITSVTMASSLVLRLVASSVRVADRSGSIVRDIMKAGNLGIVDKVSQFFCNC